MKIRERIKALQYVKPSIIERRYKVSPEMTLKLIKEEWDEMDRPRFFNGSVATSYNPELHFFEVCDTRYKRGNYCTTDEFIKVLHAQARSPREDQHMSAYTHCYRWMKHIEKTGGIKGVSASKVSAPYIWIELDREDLEGAIADSWLIANRFPYPEHMRFWHSGNKSIHIGVDSRLFGSPVGWSKDVAGRGKLFYNLAEKITGDVRHGNGYSDPYFSTREEVCDIYEDTFGESIPEGEGEFLNARKRLEGFDPALFSTNSLIRLPYSIHEKSGNPKVEVSLDGLANMDIVPTERDVPQQVKPLLLDWTFECYQKKERPKSMNTKFTTDSGMVIGVYSKYIDCFSEREENTDGFITGLFNPLYEDSRPSCSVNVKTGELHDFGSGVTYDLPEFLGKIKKIGRKKAKTIIETENYAQI